MEKIGLKWYQCIDCKKKIGKDSIKCLKSKRYICGECRKNHINSCYYSHIKFVFHGRYSTKEKPIDTELKLEDF